MTRNRPSEAAWLPAMLGMLAIHGVVVGWLWQVRDTQPAVPVERALQVSWIERPPVPRAPTVSEPASHASAPAGAVVRPSPSPPARARPGALQAVVLPDAHDAAVPQSAASLLEQAAAWAHEQAPSPDFAPDPLRHRERPRPDGRFAMRDPVSVEDVVIAVGKLFGGGPSDPCPRIRRNIAALGTGGDRELLDEELHRLQRICL